jgi:hypothetical protein
MWLQEVEQFSVGGGKEIVKLLVGNKVLTAPSLPLSVVTKLCQVDVPRVVQRETAEDWANSHGMLFLEASAKTKEGISQVFHEVVQKVPPRLLCCPAHGSDSQILENPKLLAINSTQPNQKLGGKPAKKSGGCC